MSDFVSITPARSGSKAIKNKNIELINNHPLFTYSIAVSKIIGVKPYLSTDSEIYKEIGIKYGADVPFLRPKKIAKNDSPDYEFLLHFIDYLKKTKNKAKYIIHLRPTTPLRKISILKKAIKEFKSKKNCTSLRSAHLASESYEKWFFKDKNSFFKPIVRGLDSEKINLPRQKFRPAFIPNGYIDIIKIDTILKKSQTYGNKMFVFETPQVIEIDTIFDLKLARLDKSTIKDKLLDYLNN